MRTIKKLFIYTLVVYTSIWATLAYAHEATAPVSLATVTSTTVKKVGYQKTVHQAEERLKSRLKPGVNHHGFSFKHGDISWLPQLASQAGWPKDTWRRLGQIILRESGGCPNLRGGDKVDKNCKITGVSEWNHRSDTGLMQINGINYNMNRNKWAAVCLQIDVCTQEPLLDPLINLKAAKVLYDLSGWNPWDPCAWGPEYANKCKKMKP